MKLHGWHSSSTTFRVRIALNLKQLDVEHVNVTLDWRDDDHDKPEFLAFNPQKNIPVLVDGDFKIAQSLAIVEYLEERWPEPRLLPADPAGRARVRALALNVACEIQSANNLRIQRRLADQLGADPPALKLWQTHWIEVGFTAIEAQLSQSASTGRFCHGDAPTIADIFLVPQVYNSQRPIVGADLSRWPTIQRIWGACLELPAFERALPIHQPGFESPDGH